MSVSSMTGFARAAGSGGTWRWTFELKTVNAKGLDIRTKQNSLDLLGFIRTNWDFSTGYSDSK